MSDIEIGTVVVTQFGNKIDTDGAKFCPAVVVAVQQRSCKMYLVYSGELGCFGLATEHRGLAEPVGVKLHCTNARKVKSGTDGSATDPFMPMDPASAAKSLGFDPNDVPAAWRNGGAL